MARPPIVAAALILATITAFPEAAQAHHDGADLVGGQAVDDVTGDGVPDLITISTRAPVGSLDVPAVVVEGVNGANGEVLWTVTEEGDLSWSWSFGPVGPEGTDGVVFYSEHYLEVTSFYKVVAIDAHGDIVLRYQVDGAGHLLSGDQIWLWETGDLLPGAAQDMIVARASEGAPHPGVGSAGPSFEVVDGRDGSLAHRIPIHDESSILVAPDLDGSGTGDLFRTGIDEESDRPFATALRASDLVMLWNLELEPGAADLGLPHEVGDVTGDGIVDIAFDFSRYLIIGGDPAERVRLVDGATGDLLFDLPFFGAYGAGDIDGDGLGDLILYEKLKDGSTVAFRYRAVTRYGAMLYERTYGITEPPGATVFPQSLTRVGDVNGDGIIDLYQDLAASKGGNVVAASSGVLDGSSGDFLWDAGQLTLVRSAAAPLDSLGIDLIRPSCPGNLFTLRAIAGDSGTTIWETSLDGECTGTLLDTRDMTADGVPDLVMARLSSTGASGLRVVSGADGTSVWSVP